MHAYPQLVTELDELRHQWRMTKLLEGSLLVVTGAVAVLILLVAADNVFKLGIGGRFVTLGGAGRETPEEPGG